MTRPENERCTCGGKRLCVHCERTYFNYGRPENKERRYPVCSICRERIPELGKVLVTVEALERSEQRVRELEEVLRRIAAENGGHGTRHCTAKDWAAEVLNDDPT